MAGPARTSQHLISKPCVRAVCRRCRRTVLDGVDQGLPYRVDPAPLNIIGELVALASGRSSYRRVAQVFMVRREQWNIATDVVKGRPLVLADHSCVAPISILLDEKRIVDVVRILATATMQDETDRVLHNAMLTVLGEFPCARVIDPMDIGRK